MPRAIQPGVRILVRPERRAIQCYTRENATRADVIENFGEVRPTVAAATEASRPRVNLLESSFSVPRLFITSPETITKNSTRAGAHKPGMKR